MFEEGGRFVATAMSHGASPSAGWPAAGAPSAAPPGAGVADASALSLTALVDRARAWEQAARALYAAKLIDIAELDARQRHYDTTARVGERLLGRSVPTQVGLLLGISPTAAGSWIALARTLVEDHPALVRCAADGLVSEWHLRMVAAATDHLSAEHKRVVARQLAYEIRQRASRGVKELTPHQLAQAAARRVIAIDPDAATRRCERARRSRQVSVTDLRNGAATWEVHGPAEQVLHMHELIERDARARRTDGDPRSLDAIMFDQIYDTLIGSAPIPGPDPLPQPRDPEPTEPETQAGDAHADGADTGDAAVASAQPRLGVHDLDPDDPAHDTYPAADDTAPQPPTRMLRRRRRHVEAQVVLSAATFLGLDDEPALLRGYGAIPAEIARQITDDSDRQGPARLTLRRLLCDPDDGRLVQMDSAARLYTGSLRDFVILRDQTCRLTGATIRDLDHIGPHIRGGPTSGHNAQSLAKNPHVLRDHPGISVRTRAPDPPPGESPPQPPVGSPPKPDADAPPEPSQVPEQAETPQPAPPLSAQAQRRLHWLRANAPDVEWTFPTRHTYRSDPPPALGYGSTPTPFSAPRPPPQPTETEQDAALQRRKDELLRAVEHRRARKRLHQQRLHAPSMMERHLYRLIRTSPDYKCE